MLVGERGLSRGVPSLRRSKLLRRCLDPFCDPFANLAELLSVNRVWEIPIEFPLRTIPGLAQGVVGHLSELWCHDVIVSAVGDENRQVSVAWGEFRDDVFRGGQVG